MVTQEQIIEDAHKIAVASLKNFFRNLDLNEDAYNHLYNIKTDIVNFLKPSDEAVYIHLDSMEDNPIDNTIVINAKILKKYTDLVNTKKESYMAIVLQLASSLVHEMIHANRLIIMDYVIKEKRKYNSELPPKKTWEVKSNLVSEFYHKGDILSEEDESDRIYYQGDFEETITEALADMIVKTRNADAFILEDLNDMIQSSKADMIIKTGSQILTNMGIDTVKWFMTSAYENSYYDKFEHTFGEKYDDLLYDVSDIYTSVYCEDPVNESTVNNVKRILEEKTNKKR